MAAEGVFRHSGTVRKDQTRNLEIPGSRCARPGMTLLYQARTASGIQPGGLGAEIRGPEIIRAQVGQLAFQAFDVQPERPALAEKQDRAATRRRAGMKLDPDQLKGCFGRFQVDVAGL